MPEALRAGDGETVHIDRLVHGGWGLGRLPGGKVALVTGALPGETVRIRILKDGNSHVEAAVSALLHSAPERISAPCPHYADCGGCNLQHADYAALLRMKTEIVAENLRRGGLEEAAECLAPALPSPQPLGYRHRLRLHLQERGRVGFHRRRSNRVVPVERCLLATEGINAVLTALAALTQEADLSLLSRCGHALSLAQCPASDRIFLILHTRTKLPASLAQGLKSLLAPLADVVCTTKGQCLHPQEGPKSAAAPPALRQHFSHTGLNYSLSWAPDGFFQVNCQQNAQLVALAMEAAGPGQRTLDLCCGAGNFSIPLALLGAEVLGVETCASSLHWARENARQAGLRDIRFTGADAAKELARLCRQQARFDTILLDPPRQGLGRAAALIPGLAPRRIVSISCDPATHARDLRLMLAGGYRLVRILALDMFPQTHHIETLALLERR